MSGVQTLLGARRFIFVIYIPYFRLSQLSPLPCFDGCVGGFLSLPPTATADTAERRDDLQCQSQGPVLHRPAAV